MLISCGDAQKAFDMLDLEGFSIQLLSDVINYKGEVLLKKKKHLNYESLQGLISKHIHYIEVCQTNALMQALYLVRPSVYKRSAESLPYEAIEKRLIELDFVNRYSAHRRFLICGEDILHAKGNLIFEYGETLLLSKWRKFKSLLQSQGAISIRRNEDQIGVYSNLYLSDKKMKEKFLINVNIVYNLINIESALVKDSVFESFNAERDLIVIDYPLDLLSVYKKNNIRLVIVEDIQNPVYKKSIVSLKRYDPYVRLLFVKDKVKRNDKAFCKQVAEKYLEDLWIWRTKHHIDGRGHLKSLIISINLVLSRLISW